MPTLLRIFGLRFFFYLDEHQPIHVHVECNGKLAKIELEPEVTIVYRVQFIEEWHKRFV